MGIMTNFEFGMLINGNCDETIYADLNLGTGANGNANQYLDQGSDSQGYTNNGVILQTTDTSATQLPGLSVGTSIVQPTCPNDVFRAYAFAPTSQSSVTLLPQYNLHLDCQGNTNVSSLIQNQEAYSGSFNGYSSYPTGQTFALGNDSSPGTYLSTLAILNTSTSAYVDIAGTGSTSVLGVVTGKYSCYNNATPAYVCVDSSGNQALGTPNCNAGIGGYPCLGTSGVVPLEFDGATTIGDFVAISTTQGGAGHDTASGPGLGQILQTLSALAAPSAISGAGVSGTGSLSGFHLLPAGTCVNAVGGETTQFEGSVVTMGANNVLQITAPTCPSGSVGWRPYVSHNTGDTGCGGSHVCGPGTEVLQTVTPVLCPTPSQTLARSTLSACQLGAPWAAGSITNTTSNNCPVNGGTATNCAPYPTGSAGPTALIWIKPGH
jgi:hypothetical protein